MSVFYFALPTTIVALMLFAYPLRNSPRRTPPEAEHRTDLKDENTSCPSTAHGSPGPASPTSRPDPAFVLLATALLVFISLGGYAIRGQPDFHRLRTADPASSTFTSLADALAAAEKRLAENPDDGRGWDVLAPIYLRLAHYHKAQEAYREAQRLLGRTGPRLEGEIAASLKLADGVISSKIASLIDHLHALEPANPNVRFLNGLSAMQTGDSAKARSIWHPLLEELPDGHPLIESLMAQLSKRFGEAKDFQPNPDALRPTFEALVRRLDRHLQAEGGTADAWQRLIQGYEMLGLPDEADRARNLAPQVSQRQSTTP